MMESGARGSEVAWEAPANTPSVAQCREGEMIMRAKVKLIAVCVAAVVVAGGVGVSLFAQQTQKRPADAKAVQEKTYAKTVEISEPGEFVNAGDTKFVLKKDIAVPRTGALKFTRCENIEIDLNGHTVTYNTEDYDPKKEWGSGMSVSYSKNIVIKNGTITQGSADPVNALGVGYCDDVEIDGLNIIAQPWFRQEGTIRPVGGYAIRIYRYGAARTKAPPAATYSNIIRNCYLENGGISMGEAYDYEIAGNVMVNMHMGMHIRGAFRPEAGRRRGKHNIHHNLVQPRRLVGCKSPCGLYLAASGECDVHHNKFASDNARGVISSGNGLDKNKIHHNEISARYSAASAVGYVDNRPYGIWTRNSWGNHLYENRILVINSSPHKGGANYGIGIHCGKFKGQGPGNDEFAIRDNIITVMHDFANQTSTGISFGPGSIGIFGKNETIRNNAIRAQTLCFKLDAEYFDPDSKNVCTGNVIIKPGKHDAGWQAANLKLPDGNTIKDEKLDKTAPTAPTGLKLRNHMGRATIEWKWNAEDDVVGYWVYKNGKRMPGTRFRGATFYIDVAPADGDRYSVSAQDFSGNEGARCKEVVFKRARRANG